MGDAVGGHGEAAVGRHEVHRPVVPHPGEGIDHVFGLLLGTPGKDEAALEHREDLVFGLGVDPLDGGVGQRVFRDDVRKIPRERQGFPLEVRDVHGLEVHHVERPFAGVCQDLDVLESRAVVAVRTVPDDLADAGSVGMDRMIFIRPLTGLQVLVTHIDAGIAPVDHHAGGGVLDDRGAAVAVLLVGHVLGAAVRPAVLRALVGHPAVVVGDPVGGVVGAAPEDDAARVVVELHDDVGTGEIPPELVPNVADGQGFVERPELLRRAQLTGQHAFRKAGAAVRLTQGLVGGEYLLRCQRLAVDGDFIEQPLDAVDDLEIVLRPPDRIGVALRFVVATEHQGRVG